MLGSNATIARNAKSSSGDGLTGVGTLGDEQMGYPPVVKIIEYFAKCSGSHDKLEILGRSRIDHIHVAYPMYKSWFSQCYKTV